MAAILPPLCWLLIFLTIRSNREDWRESYLTSLVIWGLLLTGMTEFLSFLGMLKFGTLCLAWLSLSLGVLTIYLQRYRQNKSANYLFDFKWLKNNQLSWFSRVLLGCIIGIVIVLGLLAIIAAPNNWDSMIYHLSRVVHWQQNYSVAHYPTYTLSQIYQNPWSEFAILHFQILSNSDRFANSIQWGCMVSSLIGVSLIAKQLGGKIREQIFSIVFCATIPMGILQASSTQNDYAVSFWLVCFAYFTLLIIEQGVTQGNTAKLGISLGLAILTKGTAYIYALPFCLWLIVWGLIYLRWKVWKPILIIGLIILAINGGHYTRNYLVFASPLGLGESEKNTYFSLKYFISNVSKHLSLHADIVRNLALEKFITPTTGITNKVIQILHKYLEVDINNASPNCPSCLTERKFYVPGLSRHEDTAGNPLHLLLIIASSGLLIAHKKLWKNSRLLHYFLVVIAGFLLFSWLIAWSHWRSRLHLPFFVLSSPWVGIVLGQSLNYRISNFLSILLIIISSSWIFQNDMKPILGKKNIFNTPRIEQYFISKSYLKDDYIKAARIAQSQECRRIGLIDQTSIKGSLYEYPLWILLNNESADSPKVIRHIMPENQSSKLENERKYSNFKPCLIVVFVAPQNIKSKPENQFIFNGDRYQQYWSGKYVKAYTPN